MSGITARGCFISVSPSDDNTSLTAFINQQNGSTISQSTLDTSSGCFAMDFRLEEAGDHILELTLGKLGGGTCNGSIPLLLEIYQQESKDDTLNYSSSKTVIATSCIYRLLLSGSI